MSKTIREPRAEGQVDLDGHTFAAMFADNATPKEAGGPGSLHVTVTLGARARQSQAYQPYREIVDQKAKVTPGELFRGLLLRAVEDDEKRAAESAASEKR